MSSNQKARYEFLGHIKKRLEDKLDHAVLAEKAYVVNASNRVTTGAMFSQLPREVESSESAPAQSGGGDDVQRSDEGGSAGMAM